MTHARLGRLFSLDKPRHAPKTPALAEPSLPRPACHQKSLNILTNGFEGSRVELLLSQTEQKNSQEQVLCSLCACKHGVHFLYVKMAGNSLVTLMTHFKKRRYQLATLKPWDKP